MKLNPRELEVLKVIHESGRALTSSEIVNLGTGLTQSTVQAVLRKLLAAGMVDVQGITHSGKVLSRNFGTTAKANEAVLRKFLDEYRCFRTIISKRAIVASMFETDDNASRGIEDIEEMEQLLVSMKQ
ncbi:MAG: MarR family transcriptional regulator [bacterium]|nr:MarR family transcriptional regulator [bacterium]MCM1374888.1 MarR family transcriptional regulator [Muribaculum sp.]